MMKKILIASIITLALASCGTMPNDVSIARIEADRDIELSKEKTKQLELELKILKEKKKTTQ